MGSTPIAGTIFKGVVIVRKYIISQDNLNEVYGALNRFFRENRSYLNYHTITGGFKHRKSCRIGNLRIFDKLGFKYQTIQRGAKVEKAQVGKMEFIRVDLGPYRGIILEAGDGIIFTGSKVVFRIERSLESGKYTYETFQIINEQSGCTTIEPNSPVYMLNDLTIQETDEGDIDEELCSMLSDCGGEYDEGDIDEEFRDMPIDYYDEYDD